MRTDIPLGPEVSGLIRAGYSDKYGQIYVERIGNTGFPDPDEPMALMRAQDRLTHRLMVYYHLLTAEAHVPFEQMLSVERQVHNFISWQERNRDKIRTPGTVNERDERKTDA